jgi:beta-glucosidase
VIVIIQAGSAVSMPWVDKVDGVIYSWYLGNEAGNAIADVVYGLVNPSGRLPLTLPRRELDIAANLDFRSARTQTHYSEGIWVGYRHFNARGIEPLFPFGYGLSYTTFAYRNLRIEKVASSGPIDEWKMVVAVDVINMGPTPGAHSAHFYTCPPAPTRTSLLHPSHTLQAFDKTPILQPRAQHRVTVTLDKCQPCFRYYCD